MAKGSTLPLDWTKWTQEIVLRHLQTSPRDETVSALCHVFGWSTIQLSNAADDVFNTILRPATERHCIDMGRKWPAQSAKGQKMLVECAAELFNHPQIRERYFSNSDYQHGIHHPWEVVGTCPGDNRPAPPNTRTWAHKFLHYVWYHKAGAKNKYAESGAGSVKEESGHSSARRGNSSTPAPAARQRRSSDALSVGARVTASLDGLDLYGGDPMDLDADARMVLTRPEELNSTPVWLTKATRQADGSVLLSFKHFRAERLLDSTGKKYSLEALRRKLKLQRQFTYGIVSTKLNQIDGPFEEDEDENEFIQEEYPRLRTAHAAADAINFIAVDEAKTVKELVPIQYRIVSNLATEGNEFTIPPPANESKKRKRSEAANKAAAPIKKPREGPPRSYDDTNTMDSMEQFGNGERDDQTVPLPSSSGLPSSSTVPGAGSALQSTPLPPAATSGSQEASGQTGGGQVSDPAQVTQQSQPARSPNTSADSGQNQSPSPEELASRALQQERQSRFPYMTYACDAAEAKIDKKTLDEPSIPMKPGYMIKKVEWLSTDLQAFSNESELDRPDENDIEKVQQDWRDAQVKNNSWIKQITAGFWDQACQLMGYDPEEQNPNALVACPGMNKAYRLKPYQAASVAWGVKQAATSEPSSIMGLDTGLGKTCVITGLSCRLMELQLTYHHEHGLFAQRNQHLAEPPINFQEPHAQGDRNNLQEIFGVAPNLNVGPQLYITQPGILANLIRETIAMFDATVHPSRRAFFCICPQKDRRKDKLIGTKLPDNYFYLDEKIRFGDDAFPDLAALAVFWGPEKIEQWKRNGITPREILQVHNYPSRHEEDDDAPYCYARNGGYGYQTNWIVITTTTMANKWLMLVDPVTGDTNRYSDKVKPHMILAAFSYVHYDEFHETLSSTATPWPLIAGLAGRPPVFAYSGTPFEAMSDLFALTTAGLSRWMRCTNGKDAQKIKAHLDLGKQNITRQAGMTDNDWAFVEARCYQDMDEHVKVINAYRKLGGNEIMNDDEVAAMSEIKSRLAHMLLRMTEEYAWTPRTEAVRAIAMPPNTAFDIDITSNLSTEQRLAFERFVQQAQADCKALKMRWVRLASMLSVVTTFPELALEMEQDPDIANELDVEDFAEDEEKHAPLGEELKQWTTDTVHDIVGQRCPKLAALIPKLARGSTMSECCRIGTEAAKQVNSHGFPRKIIYSATKPLTHKLMELCFSHAWNSIETSAPGTHPEWEFLRQDPVRNAIPEPLDTDAVQYDGSDHPFVFLNSWQTQQQKERNLERLKFFCRNSNANYANGKRILVALSSQIKTGLNLSPANLIVMVDQTWNTKELRQVGGRIRRAAVSQKNRFTEFYRLVHQTPKVDWATRLCDKHVTQALMAKGFPQFLPGDGKKKKKAKVIELD